MPKFIRLESCATFFELVIRSPLHLLQSLFSILICRYLAPFPNDKFNCIVYIGNSYESVVNDCFLE